MERLAHIPVMLEECMEGLNLKDNGIYFDGTLGGGGHSYEILRRTSAGRLVATDLDTESIARAKEKLAEFEGRFAIAHDNYKNFKYVLKENGIEAVDGILLDFGVSSFQLDDKSRGFSYNADCALDMRMNPDQSLTAKEVVNTYSEEALRRILSEYRGRAFFRQDRKGNRSGTKETGNHAFDRTDRNHRAEHSEKISAGRTSGAADIPGDPHRGQPGTGRFERNGIIHGEKPEKGRKNRHSDIPFAGRQNRQTSVQRAGNRLCLRQEIARMRMREEKRD